MIYSLLFLSELEENPVNGYFWYEEKGIGLGEDFLRVFYTLSEEIRRNPLVYKTVYKDFRRYSLKRFPYAIYYRVDKAEIIVYGLSSFMARCSIFYILMPYTFRMQCGWKFGGEARLKILPSI